MDEDNILEAGELAERNHYQGLLSTGEWIEEVCSCLDCGYGETSLIPIPMLNQDYCSECGSTNVVQTPVQF